MDKITAQRAAKWWADQLRKPASLDNGDQSDTGAMTLMLATLLQDQERSSQNDQDITAFERELADILETQDASYFHLGVDYHPDRTLSQAAQNSGLNLGMASLPWKTTMWIEDNEIRVSEGYRANPITV